MRCCLHLTPEKKQGKSSRSSGGPSVAKIFKRMPDAFRADKAKDVDVVFGYSITGQGGGDWSVSICDGACTVTEGKVDKPTTTIEMAADDFMAMISGKLNPMAAFSSGQLKIGGDIMKSQLIEKLFKF